MTYIIGYGNSLRGEDGFGLEVVKKLQNFSLNNVKLISLFQLTPELCLQLLDAKKLIFIDATFSNEHQYTLACSLEKSLNSNLSHHISPFTIIQTLKTLYEKDVAFEIYTILTSSFDSIKNNLHYNSCIDKSVKQIISTLKK